MNDPLDRLSPLAELYMWGRLRGHEFMKTTFTGVALAGAVAIMAGGCADVAFPDITNGQGEIAGEVTTTSVILQSRLTVGSELPG